MTTQPPNLTPQQIELLAMLAEEAGEIIQEVGKILRHGYDSYHPNDTSQQPNRITLVREIIDLMAVVMLMEDDLEGCLDTPGSLLDEAIIRKLKYTHHQKMY